MRQWSKTVEALAWFKCRYFHWFIYSDPVDSPTGLTTTSQSTPQIYQIISAPLMRPSIRWIICLKYSMQVSESSDISCTKPHKYQRHLPPPCLTRAGAWHLLIFWNGWSAWKLRYSWQTGQKSMHSITCHFLANERDVWVRPEMV